MGQLKMGSRCLLVILVSGNSLLPDPPASTMPFISFHHTIPLRAHELEVDDGSPGTARQAANCRVGEEKAFSCCSIVFFLAIKTTRRRTPWNSLSPNSGITSRESCRDLTGWYSGDAAEFEPAPATTGTATDCDGNGTVLVAKPD